MDHPGRTALSICEAMILTLHERGFLARAAILGLLHDAAMTQRNAARLTGRADHDAATRLIYRIIARTELLPPA